MFNVVVAWGYNSQKAIKKTNDTKNVETVCQSGG